MTQNPLNPRDDRSEATPDYTSGHIDRISDQHVRADSHPVLAIVVFVAAFVFAALPFLSDTDNFFIVAPCVIASLSCSILFMRLVMGDLGPVKWIMLATAGYACVSVGREWYIVVLLTTGTVLCSILIDRLVGDFVPLTRAQKH